MFEAYGGVLVTTDEFISSPLIVSLRMDSESQRFFDTLRSRLFPAHLNFLGAHVTLFHHLPGAERPRVEADMASATEQQEIFRVAVTGLRNLGRGVAYTLDSPALLNLRAKLAGSWFSWLNAQDRQGFKPHLTVQNKVEPGIAKTTLSELQSAFKARSITAVGLDLWRYEGGPWQHLRTLPFAGPASR